MSKTLFNQNTFQNKNVTNDGDITELTKATADIAANTAAIAGKQDILTTGEGINISVLPSTTTIKFDGSALSSDIVSGGDITGIELKYTDVNGVVKNVEDEINGKQNDLTAGDGIDIDGADEISLSGTRTGNFIITGNFESSGTEYKLWNETRGGTGTSNGRALVHTGSGTKETSILRVNYTDDFGGGTQIDSIVGIAKEPDSAYDLDVNGNVNIGGVLSLPNVSSVAGAFQTLSDEDAYMLGLFDGKQDTLTDADNAGTNISISEAGVISANVTTYTAGDGIDIDGSNQISFNGVMSQTIITSGSITGATMNYVDNGVVTNIQTEIETKQDILTDTDNAGDNVSISETGVISSTDTTYTDTGDGAIYVDADDNYIKLDFSRTDEPVPCPQQFSIQLDTTPQLLVGANPARGGDLGDGASADITILGQRISSESLTPKRAAQLKFKNRDYSLSNTRDLFELAGQVTNTATNIGGMVISNYADGQTRSGNTTMSANGNWYFGGGGAFQDTYKVKIGGNTDIDGVLSITGYPDVKSALDTATGGGGGGTTYTALADGGLEINASNEIGIDFSNTSSAINIPQLVVISTDANTAEGHLVIQPESNTGQDAIVKIRGRRNGTTNEREAQIHFQNYDSNDGTGGSTAYLGEIAGVVTNDVINIGGLGFYYFSNGSTSTRTAGMTMNANGRFHIGSTFQDIYKLQVTGNTYFTGNSIIDGTLQIGGITNVRTAIEGKQDPISALSGGGLAVSNDEISIDFSNTSAAIDIPQRVVIENDTTAQLIVKTTSGGNDAAITIRGERNTTSNRQAQLRFENTLSGTNNDLAEIAGVVTNAGSNIGGLGIYNFANGSTRTTAMTMNENGRFHFGTSFQNDYKLQVTGNTNFTGDNINGGNSYIKQGLILDPYDMGTTTFTNGNTDGNASATSREDIYIKFAPFTSTGNDWVYLRNIGTSNAGHIALDYHDDTNDVRFSIRNIHSSGQDPDVITEVFKVLSTGVTANTAVYREPQMVFYNFNISSMTGSSSGSGGNRFGDEGRFNSLASTRTTGTSFSSHSNGTFTFSANGYYKIRVCANNQNLTYDDRTAFGVYLNINGTEYWENRNYNFFGWTYTRNTGDGAHGNIVFEDYMYIANTQTLQVRTKLDTNNRSWDDSLSTGQMRCYCNLQIERIAETDIR